MPETVAADVTNSNDFIHYLRKLFLTNCADHLAFEFFYKSFQLPTQQIFNHIYSSEFILLKNMERLGLAFDKCTI